MKNFFNYLAITTVLFIFNSQISLAGEVDLKISQLFADNPQNDSFTLSSGVKVTLPVHYYQIEALVSVGTVNLKALEPLMQGTGLHPVPITSKSGLAAIYLVNHPSNSIGKYQEFVVLIAATADPERAKMQFDNKTFAFSRILSAFFPTSADRNARGNRDFIFYVPFISVSTEDALLAGREIWNLPKELAKFNISYEGKKNSATLDGANCKLSMDQSENHMHLKLPLYMDFNLVGQWNGNITQIVRAPMVAHGVGYTSLYSKKSGDKFYADPNTACGQWLSTAKYKPVLWQYVPRSGSVLYNRNTEVNLHLDNKLLESYNSKQVKDFFEGTTVE